MGNINLPFGINLLNPELVDSRQKNNLKLPYTNTAEVLTQNISAIRTIGQQYVVFNEDGVSTSIWTFKDGISDNDLVKLDQSSKNISSISDLRNQSASIGDVVNVLGYYSGSSLGGGNFKAIKEEGKQIYFDKNLLQYAKKASLTIPLLAGDTVSIRFKFPSQASLNYFFVLASTTNLLSLRLTSSLVANDGFDFSISGVGGYNATNIRVVDDLGNSVDRSELLWDTYYTVSMDAVNACDVKQILIAQPFGTYVSMYLSDFTIKDEVFTCNEGSGTTITGSNGTVVDLFNSPDWSQINIDNGFNLIQTSSNIVFERLVGESVSVMDFGAKPATSLTDYSFDNTPIFQSALDSRYNPVTVPALSFNIDSEIKIKTPKNLQMTGNFSFMDIGVAAETQTVTIEEDTSTTKIFSQNNIDYFRIQSKDVVIENGMIYTANSLLHDKSAVVWDYNYFIWKGLINNVFVYGNEANLLTTGLGTKAFYFDVDNITQYGYFHRITINASASYCAYGVYHPVTSSEVSESNNWSNTHTFNLAGDGCKCFYHIAVSGCSVTGLQQGRGVRNLEESSTIYGIYVSGGNSYCDARIIDYLNVPSEVLEGKYRYSAKNTYVNRQSGAQISPSLNRGYSIGIVDTDLRLPNSDDGVDNPNRFYVSSKSAGFISSIENPLMFASDYGIVSYKGFKAVNSDWFDANLYEAESVSNTTPLTEAVSGISIQNPQYLLSSSLYRNEAVGQTITDAVDTDLYFGEIVITDLDSYLGVLRKIQRFYLATDKSLITKLQVIFHFDAGIKSISADNPYSSNDVNQASWDISSNRFNEYQQSNINKIIIRLIGTHEVNEQIRVKDVAIRTQYAVRRALLETSGAQKLNGFLSPFGIVPRTQTWAEIVALKVAGDLYVGNTFIVSDQANKQVLISGYSPDGNFWYKDTDIYGVETINKVE